MTPSENKNPWLDVIAVLDSPTIWPRLLMSFALLKPPPARVPKSSVSGSELNPASFQAPEAAQTSSTKAMTRKSQKPCRVQFMQSRGIVWLKEATKLNQL